MTPNNPNVKPISPPKTGKKRGVCPSKISTLLDHRLKKVKEYSSD